MSELENEWLEMDRKNWWLCALLYRGQLSPFIYYFIHILMFFAPASLSHSSKAVPDWFNI